jgi:hypothetical protein
MRVLLDLVAAQGKQVYILDIRNAFPNTIYFDLRKRTHNKMSPFCVEYLPLHWATHPDLGAVETDSTAFVVQKCCSVQGKKDAGQKFYQIICNYLWHIVLQSSILDHGIVIWKQEASEMLLSVAMYDCMVLVPIDPSSWTSRPKWRPFFS